MSLSTAPVVGFLDNDATFESNDVLARGADIFAARASVAAISLRVLLSSTRELDQLSWVDRLDRRYRAGATFMAAQFVGAGFMLRRSADDRTAGLHSPLFFYWEELDLSYALQSAGFDVLHVGELSVLHNVSPERRVTWAGGRFYYYVRNRVAIEWKYFGLGKAVLFSGWYLLLAIRRGHIRDAVRGLRDARGLYETPGGVMSRVGRRKVRKLTPSKRERAYLALAKLRGRS